jgi:hypothetical protein
MKGMIGFSGTHSFPPCMVIFSLMKSIIPKWPASVSVRSMDGNCDIQRVRKEKKKAAR